LNGERTAKSVDTYLKDGSGILVIGNTKPNGEMKYKARKLNTDEIQKIEQGKYVKMGYVKIYQMKNAEI
jgi:hypothetical protein